MLARKSKIGATPLPAFYIWAATAAMNPLERREIRRKQRRRGWHSGCSIVIDGACSREGGFAMSRVISTAARGLAAVVLVLGLAGPARAAGEDAWVTTKAKIALLTSEGVSAWDVNVDTQDGNVTIHGKVATEAEKTKAESVVRKLDGVKSVRNLLQVVPKSEEKAVKATDSQIKDRVEGAFKSDPSLKDEGIKVASVNQGVVLLSGKATTLDRKLHAIEAAASVGGVKRVASEIRTEPE